MCYIQENTCENSSQTAARTERANPAERKMRPISKEKSREVIEDMNKGKSLYVAFATYYLPKNLSCT